MACFALSSTVSAGTESNIVDTGYAKYLGNRSYPNTVAYLGIPYAEPPIGDRRFRAPLPLNTTRVASESKGAVINATQYPDFCIQGTTGSGDGSEDCLKVNIYAPVNATKHSDFPVLVYIYGGGYVNGNPANWPFDHWINQSPNIIAVSVYYRLSSFGFLAVPALQDPSNGALNAGFLDQIQALKWVQANIQSFGGDPGKLHLVANAGARLFSQAIAQSVYRTFLPTPEQQEPLFDFYANHAGCGQGTPAQQLSCLRKASVGALAKAQYAAILSAITASGPSGYNLFRPVIDGTITTDFPTKSILAGKFAKVPLIVGATSNEILSIGTDIAAALRSFFPSLTNASTNALIAKYPLSKFGTADLQFQTLTGDSELRCARSIMGTAFGAAAKSWTYRYNQRKPGDAAVGHASENWMMLDGTTTFAPMSAADVSFAQELIAYWISFVRSGDPNTFKLEKSPSWTAFTNIPSA
ncbi:Alpha/Beta hydrolase protein [Pholiota molesta]|nr:Alpha/Beta hydrolase protein [Pholiota molesta]